MSNVIEVPPLTLDELRLAAAAVTALLPKYAPHRDNAAKSISSMGAFAKLKRLQLRLFELEQAMTGDHPRYTEATQQTVEELSL